MNAEMGNLDIVNFLPKGYSMQPDLGLADCWRLGEWEGMKGGFVSKSDYEAIKNQEILVMTYSYPGLPNEEVFIRGSEEKLRRLAKIGGLPEPEPSE